MIFDFLNYVDHSRGFSYLCDVHTNTSRTHPETYHALAIGSDLFFAAHCLANMLRVFACEELSLRSSPTSSVDRSRFHATNGCHGLQTPPRPLLIACIHNKREVHQLFTQQSPEIQLTEGIKLKKSDWASRVFTSTTARIKVHTLILQSLVLTLSSNDLGECRALLWSST